MISFIHKYLTKYPVFFFFLVFSVILSVLSLGSLKFLILVFIIAFLILSYIVDDFFTAALLLTIFSIPFFKPGKYYYVELIRGYEIQELYYSESFLADYGINIFDILLGVTFFLLIRDEINAKNATFFKKKIVKVLLLSGGCFLGLSLIGITLNSPFPILSLFRLIRFLEIFIFPIVLLFYFIYKKDPKHFNIVSVLFTSLLYQFGISILQFFSQSNIGLAYEATQITQFATGLDENNSLFRTQGTFVYHNQFGLFSAITSLAIVVLLPKKNKNFLIFTYLIGLVSIVLSQSRSVLVGFSLASYYLSKQTTIFSFVSKLNKKIFLYVFLIALLCLPILVPRIVLSLNFFERGAGGYVRVLQLQESLDAILRSPWIGFGPGVEERVLINLFPNGVTAVFPAAPHFAFFQLLLNFGLLGLVLLVAPFIIALAVEKDIANRVYKNIFTSSLIVLFVFYLFLPFSSNIDSSLVGFILGFGIVAYYIKGVKNEKKKY